LTLLLLLKYRLDVTANVCDFSSSDGQLFVMNQTDIDEKVDGCTTIDGTIIISPKYTGTFIIRNVTNITQQITTQIQPMGGESPLPFGEEYPTPLLTSFQADSVISMPGSLNLDNVPALKSVSMANLEFIESFYIDSNPGLTISFPQLKNASQLEVLGGFSR
jgi:hypothetical protein